MKLTVATIAAILFVGLGMLVHIAYQDNDFWNGLYFLKEDIVLLLLFVALDRYSKSFWQSLIIKFAWIYAGERMIFNLLCFLGFIKEVDGEITVYFYISYCISILLGTIVSLVWEKKNY